MAQLLRNLRRRARRRPGLLLRPAPGRRVPALERMAPGAPRIERVQVEVDHVGLFDAEYRGFADVTVHRMWTLQRLNGGPWRLAANSRNGI